jgi:hypothetical protein
MVGHRLPGFDQLPIGQRGDVDQAGDQRQEVPRRPACDRSHAASLGPLGKADKEFPNECGLAKNDPAFVMQFALHLISNLDFVLLTFLHDESTSLANPAH